MCHNLTNKKMENKIIIVMPLNDIQRQILEAAIAHVEHYGEDYSYFNYSILIDIGTKKELQPEMKVLKELGLLNYVKGLLNEDGETFGAGYSIPYGKIEQTKELLRSIKFKD